MNKFICFFLLLTSCSYMPEITKSVEDIATDGVIQVQVDKEAFEGRTDISVTIIVKTIED